MQSEFHNKRFVFFSVIALVMVFGGVFYLGPNQSESSGVTGAAVQATSGSFTFPDSQPQSLGNLQTDKFWTVEFVMTSAFVQNYRNPFDANFNPSGSNLGPRFEQYDNGQFNFIVGNGNSPSQYFNKKIDIISAGNPYHVAAVRFGDNVTVYLNGVKKIDQINVLWPAGFANIMVGKGFSESPERRFAGSISNVQVVASAKTEAQIIADCQAAGVCATSTAPPLPATPINNGDWETVVSGCEVQNSAGTNLGNDGRAVKLCVFKPSLPRDIHKTFNTHEYRVIIRRDYFGISSVDEIYYCDAPEDADMVCHASPHLRTSSAEEFRYISSVVQFGSIFMFITDWKIANGKLVYNYRQEFHTVTIQRRPLRLP